jgi:hypothetical protein
MSLRSTRAKKPANAGVEARSGFEPLFPLSVVFPPRLTFTS